MITVPHHPANPATHVQSVRYHLQVARERNNRLRSDPNPIREKLYSAALICACESAEEAALLTGAPYSILPGAPERKIHNDIWR